MPGNCQSVTPHANGALAGGVRALSLTW